MEARKAVATEYGGKILAKPPGTAFPPRTGSIASPTDFVASVAHISARLDRLPATKAIWKLVALLSIGLFFELYDLMYSGYIAPGLVKSGILTTHTLGLFGTNGVAGFIAALFAGLFVGTAACGFLSDRFGRRNIFTYSLLWYTSANIIMAFQETALGLNAWRFIAGIGIGVEIVTIGTFISEIAPKHIRGRAHAMSQAVGFTSVPIAALLSYFLVPRQFGGMAGWRIVVLIGAVSALGAWWLRRALPESPRWLALKGRFEEANQTMEALERKVQAEYGRPLPEPVVAEEIRADVKFRDLAAAPYRQRLAMLILLNVFQTIGYYGFANWIPILLINQGVTVTSSLMYSFVIAIAAPVGPVLGMLIVDRFERKFVIIGASAVALTSGLSFSETRASFSIISLGIILVLANNMSSCCIHAYQSELFPTSIRARAVGFVYSWSRVAAVFSAFLISWLLKEFGSIGVFSFISTCMFIVMLSIGILGPRTRNVALDSEMS